MVQHLKNFYHYSLALLGSIIYRNPSRDIVVVGITGTKGKTTSAELLRAVLMGAGKKTAMLSSANIAYGEEIKPTSFHNTMPGRFFIQKFLREAVKKGCTHAVFEVTSQGVVQHRHRFIDFDVAALTCLHPEHIESHGSYEAYRGAKVKFFRDVATLSQKQNKHFFINTETGGDAQFFEESVRHPVGAGNFGEVHFYNKESFVKNELGGDISRVSSWLQSDFNLQNAALVFEIAKALGCSAESVIGTYSKFAGVAGRMEFVIPPAGRGEASALPAVLIDAALTPGSLRALYQHLSASYGLQPIHQGPGRLIAVFGSAGGGRDKWKRPELGAIADEFCQKIYLTTDDPYDESAEQIAKDIAVGIKNKEKYQIILSREEAIRSAIKSAGEKDVVAITGMGSQTKTYGPKGSEQDWSDAAVVRRILGV
jgi:UDP-N-acetylmuramoyl-L-alanyl-D-glutamate--2,6-diaminopimelate ligase